MNTRRSKRNITPEPNILEEQVPDKRDASTSTDEQPKESFQEQTAEIGQAPVFNIHIHVPANIESKATKMYLPRIQPIIHIHFDELVEKFGNNTSQQERGLREKFIQNVLIQSTPKFGNIRFHYRNNSLNGHFSKNETNNLNQKQTLREKNSSIELESNRYNITVTMQKPNSDSTDHSEDSNNFHESTQGKMDGELSNVVINNGQPVKLKKAVVVLNDICKSRSYKSGLVSDLFNNKNSKSAQNSPSSLLDGVTSSGPQIKIECTPLVTPDRAHVADDSEKPTPGSDNGCINPFNSNICSASVNFEFPGKRKASTRDSLTSLVEGCNFSEILEKFRVKHRRCSDEYLGKLDISSEAQTVIEDNKRLINDTVWPTESSVQTKNEVSWADQSNDVYEMRQEEQEDNKDRVTLQDETSIDRNEIGNQPLANSYESKVDTETSELNIPANPSVEGNRNEVVPMNGNYGIECSVNQFYVAEIESDDNEITTRNKLSSDVVEDLRNVVSNVSNNISDVVIKSEFVVVETNDPILTDKEDQYFDLNLIKKEMVSPKKGTDKVIQYEKRKSQDVSGNESSPKKMKQSPGTPKKSMTKGPTVSSVGEGYIPLNIPGPTKFALAPLSSVQACKAHDARNFKKDMLFGDRINRFSNAGHLRMYKLKKQAAGRSVYENEKTS